MTENRHSSWKRRIFWETVKVALLPPSAEKLNLWCDVVVSRSVFYYNSPFRRQRLPGGQQSSSRSVVAVQCSCRGESLECYRWLLKVRNSSRPVAVYIFCSYQYFATSRQCGLNAEAGPGSLPQPIRAPTEQALTNQGTECICLLEAVGLIPRIPLSM